MLAYYTYNISLRQISIIINIMNNIYSIGVRCMVTLFTSPSCTSCRKAKAWLQEHDIPYTERNIF